MDSKTSLHKQLASHFTKISLVFLLSVFILLYLIYARETELDAVNSSAVPALQKQAALHHLTWQSMVLFQQLTESTEATQLTDKHQQLLSLLAQIRQLTPVGKRQLSLIVDRFEKLNVHARTITNHAEINELLHKNVLIQLQLVHDQLNQEITSKQLAMDKLSQQITEDKVSDSVTVSRAKAHLNLTSEMTLLTKTLNSVVELQVMFQRLSIRSVQVDFNYLTNRFSEILTYWQPALTEYSKSDDSSNKLLLVLQELQLLMFGEQNVVAKWRGHIRIAQQYIEQVTLERQNTLEILQRVRLPTITQPEFPGYLAVLLAPYAKYNYRNFLLAILIVVSVLYLLLIVQIRHSKRQLKQYESNLLSVVERSSSGSEVIKEQITTKSLATVCEEITQLKKPLHNESDYQQLQASFQEQQAFYLEHLGSFYTKEPTEIPSTLSEILSKGSNTQHNTWRALFSNQQIKALLKTAKQSKKQQTVSRCIVDNKWGASFSFTMLYLKGQWRVLIQDRQVYINLQHALEQQLNDAKAEINSLQYQHQTQLSELQLTITRALLSTQNTAKSYEDHYQQLYRRFQETITWCHQALFLGASTKRIPEYTAEVNVSNFTHSVMNNIALEQKSKTNRVFLSLSHQIAEQATISQPYAYDFLLTIGKLVLQEQISAVLLLSVDVKDINPGQQVLTIDYQVKHHTNHLSIPAIVALLNDDKVMPNTPIVIPYLQALCRKLHIKDLRISQLEHGFNLNFDLPLAVASHREKPAKDVYLKQQQIYLLSTDPYLTSFINDTIIDNHGKVEVFSKAAQVRDALHVKHLKKHADSVLIITSEFSQKDLELMTNHFNGLPEKIAPKLQFIQGFSGQYLTRTGLCSLSDNAISNVQLLTSLSGLLHNSGRHNQLLSRKVFNHYHYRASKVQVLLASDRIARLAPLITLLQWAGVKVTTVSEAHQAINYWQTGRFTLLLTDFTQSPYVELSAGRKLNRGVFRLDSTASNIDTPEDFLHWQIGTLAPIDKLEELLAQLAPWLSPLPSLELIESKNKPVEKLALSKKKEISKPEKPIRTTDIEPTQHLAHQTPFDLSQYAENQGSPELAVFMLEDYLQDISQAISTISSALKNNNIELDEPLSILINSSKIVAAEQLYLSANALAQAVAVGHSTDIHEALQTVITHHQALHDFCQAI
ncbi:hypothetical protein [Thalassotalea sp. PP2-459]|uniref:hypothetical protein n=1 Tax=Thalassotalea sp. PP2-459 TaxID=1742724 RepID=UPI000942EDB1|nr:hypothetical protein [Thalassotalea sp. PP2-459]OKY26833.1 hypothetical protein BI291_02230 [Thalassotalea sp. PP2-459]